MICRITVLGVVQGVGYRPFAARLAEELSIEGTVKNSSGMVVITASGSEEAMEAYIHRLQFPYHGKRNSLIQLPSGAQVMEVRIEPFQKEAFFRVWEEAGGTERETFVIAKSDLSSEAELPLIPPDLGVCEDCLRELGSSGDRRYGHALISCVACGPRFSIMNRLPYDRDTTVMESFPMCEACKAEYTGEGRRRHAQTISCHDCGPQLTFWNLTGSETVLQTAPAMMEAMEVVRGGGIIAVKGMGGYQLICLPGSAETVNRLRILKGREKKPFAVMFHNIDRLKQVCFVSPEEEALLCSSARPIVLLEKGREAFIQAVSGDSRYLGVFLPNTPIQSLLTEALGPVVVTSCNRSAEPMMVSEEEVLGMKTSLLAGILSHDRQILTPLDDSVTAMVMGKLQIIRRSRGYVPMPVRIAYSFQKPVLAMGGDLKACFGLGVGTSVYLSQYFGDLESLAVLRTYEAGVERMEGLFGIRPATVVCDLHPDYVSSGLARRLRNAGVVDDLIEIQHHHAHVGSVMAEHDLDGCIGVAFDGIGYGTDGAVWGSEFMYCSGSQMKRMGHLSYTLFCGGDHASRDGELALMCYLAENGVPYEDERYPLVQAALEHHVNTILCSSMGRLFDAVSAALNIRKKNGYEGECAMALEQAAYEAMIGGKQPYPLWFELTEGEEITASAPDLMGLLREAAERQPKVTAGELALGFHHGVADLVLQVCLRIRGITGESRTALGGGVFANRLLLQLCRDRLTEAGFVVYWNEKVPCNDGGLALGQAWLCRR